MRRSVGLHEVLIRRLADEADGAFAASDRARFADALGALVEVALRAPGQRS